MPHIHEPTTPEEAKFWAKKSPLTLIDHALKALAQPILAALMVSTTCVIGSIVLQNPLSEMLGKAVYDLMLGYTKQIIPALLQPYAMHIAVGLPFTILGWHVLDGIINNTLFLPGNEKYKEFSPEDIKALKSTAKSAEHKALKLAAELEVKTSPDPQTTADAEKARTIADALANEWQDASIAPQANRYIRRQNMVEWFETVCTYAPFVLYAAGLYYQFPIELMLGVASGAGAVGSVGIQAVQALANMGETPAALAARQPLCRPETLAKMQAAAEARATAEAPAAAAPAPATNDGVRLGGAPAGPALTAQFDQHQRQMQRRTQQQTQQTQGQTRRTNVGPDRENRPPLRNLR